MHPINQHPPASASPHGAANQPHSGHPPATPLIPGKLLRLAAVEAYTGLKRSSIYAGMRARTFPGSVRLSARAVAWRESEVQAWIDARTKTGGDRD